MSKVVLNGITFDSELELEYYDYLRNNDEVLDFKYHPIVSFKNLVGKRSYTPDFIVVYADRIEIVETKGYNQYSFRIDNAIHDTMKNLSEIDLREYVEANDYHPSLEQKIVYRKIKHLKTYGWVDYEWKNPNTIANKRKNKITDLEAEIKELQAFKKDAMRYFSYKRKLANKQKLTKEQDKWYVAYILKILNEELK